MKECAFCPSTKLTKEHIWGDWIGRLIPSSSFDFRHETSTKKERKWSDSTMSATAKVVCKDCNSGWMSNLESQARLTFANMISHAGSISLLSSGLHLLAKYAFKCAVVGNHMLPNNEPFFERWCRYQFRRSLEIPPGIQMWLGGYKGERLYSGRWSSYYFRPTMSKYRDIEFFAFTFVAGNLIFQVLSAKRSQIHKAFWELPMLQPPAQWDNAAPRFWPLDGFPISWPPRAYFDDNSYFDFRDRWKVPILFPS